MAQAWPPHGHAGYYDPYAASWAMYLHQQQQMQYYYQPAPEVDAPPLPDGPPPPLPSAPPPPLPPDSFGSSYPPYSHPDSHYSSIPPPPPGPPPPEPSFGTQFLPRAPSRQRKDTREWGSRSVESFETIEQIGEGTYGKVFMARNRTNPDEIVALKKVRMDHEKEGFPITAIREIKILKHLKHKNVINLKEVVTSKSPETNQSKGSVYMVFEYMDHDLTGLVEMPGVERFTEPQVKCYVLQLLEGLQYCHDNNILHRDIKGANLLINNKGELKLADFGLARPFNVNANNYTSRVITLWYRPPELLLGATQYGPAVDMWSVGCILAELLMGKPLFPGKTEPEQFAVIMKMCGYPSEDVEAMWKTLPFFEMFDVKRTTRRVRHMLSVLPGEAVDLIDSLLVHDPRRRLTASQARAHPYFMADPPPCDPSSLPAYPSSHEFQAKRRRNASKQSARKKQKGVFGQPVDVSHGEESGA